MEAGFRSTALRRLRRFMQLDCRTDPRPAPSKEQRRPSSSSTKIVDPGCSASPIKASGPFEQSCGLRDAQGEAKMALAVLLRVSSDVQVISMTSALMRVQCCAGTRSMLFSQEIFTKGLSMAMARCMPCSSFHAFASHHAKEWRTSLSAASFPSCNATPLQCSRHA